MLEQRTQDDILHLKLDRAPVNALNPELINTLLDALKAGFKSHRGIVISGSPKIFSAGLDVPTLLQLDETTLVAFWKAFFELQMAIADAPIPVAAAITGHSPAGGAVIALYCDYRVMAEGAFKIGLNEAQVGLPLPYPIFNALRFTVGERHAARLASLGAMISADEALQCNFVDALVPVEQVVEHAHAFVAQLLKLPPKAMLQTRKMSRQALVDGFEGFDLDSVQKAWSSPETQGAMKALVKSLQQKKS